MRGTMHVRDFCVGNTSGGQCTRAHSRRLNMVRTHSKHQAHSKHRLNTDSMHQALSKQRLDTDCMHTPSTEYTPSTGSTRTPCTLHAPSTLKAQDQHGLHAHIEHTPSTGSARTARTFAAFTSSSERRARSTVSTKRSSAVLEPLRKLEISQFVWSLWDCA